MTGIEAISNAVPAFQAPAATNARRTLSVMIVLLISMFAGVVLLAHLDGVVPGGGQTVLSQLAHESVGGGVLYVYVQAATALVLLLAANTAFNGFPRLLFFMACDSYAPRTFLRMGDRLAFSHGIVALAVVAAAVFAGFGGKTESLIPLYAVGVFLAFTLAQTGMVVHWRRHRERHWRKSALINAVGAALSAVVLAVTTITKFAHGAWLVVLLIPLIVWACRKIHAHYQQVHTALIPSADDRQGARPRPSAAPAPLPALRTAARSTTTTRSRSRISYSWPSPRWMRPACTHWPTRLRLPSQCWRCTSAPTKPKPTDSTVTGRRGATICP